MSKYMQLRVRIDPFYKKGFADVYPRIARGLEFLEKDWTQKDPSLLELVGKLDQLVYQLEANPPAREIFLKYKSKLHGLYEKIEEHIADWHLAKADQLLYQIEDIFDEIEKELAKI